MKKFLQFGGFLAILGNFGIVLMCMAIIYEFFRWRNWKYSDDMLILLFVFLLFITASMSIFFITKILVWERSIQLNNNQILDFNLFEKQEDFELTNIQLWGIGNIVLGLLIIGFAIYILLDSYKNGTYILFCLMFIYGLFILTIQLVFKKYQKKLVERNSGEGWKSASE